MMLNILSLSPIRNERKKMYRKNVPSSPSVFDIYLPSHFDQWALRTLDKINEERTRS